MNNEGNHIDSFGKGIVNDHSLLFLLISNLIAIFFAIYADWPLVTIMFVYWCQSIIIGFFSFIRIITLKKYRTGGTSLTFASSLPVRFINFLFGFFFLSIYVSGHLAYFFFLIMGDFLSPGVKLDFSNWTVLFVILSFVLNHTFSFFYNLKNERNKKHKVERLLALPYFRVIPMHFTIVIGGFFILWGFPFIALLLFLFLKTLIDVGMHVLEHREFGYLNKSSENLKISLNKADYRQGEQIYGKLIFDFPRPKKANFLKVYFIFEKVLKISSGSREITKRYKIYESRKILDFNKKYTRGVYNFDFKIPDDFDKKFEKSDEKKRFLSDKRYAVNSGFEDAQEYNNFYIKSVLKTVSIVPDIKKIKILNVY